MKDEVLSVKNDISVLKDQNRLLFEKCENLVKEVGHLKSNANDAEQRLRKFSLRISGFDIPTSITDSIGLAKLLYNSLFFRILSFDPNFDHLGLNWYQAVEIAHDFKKSRNPNSTDYEHARDSNNIIVRFHSREIVMSILQNKKKAFKAFETSSDPYIRDLAKVSIFPDLTQINLDRKKQFYKDPAVSSSWFNNRLKFRIHGNQSKVFTSYKLNEMPIDIVPRHEYDRACQIGRENANQNHQNRNLQHGTNNDCDRTVSSRPPPHPYSNPAASGGRPVEDHRTFQPSHGQNGNNTSGQDGSQSRSGWNSNGSDPPSNSQQNNRSRRTFVPNEMSPPPSYLSSPPPSLHQQHNHHRGIRVSSDWNDQSQHLQRRY